MQARSCPGIFKRGTQNVVPFVLLFNIYEGLSSRNERKYIMSFLIKNMGIVPLTFRPCPRPPLRTAPGVDIILYCYDNNHRMHVTGCMHVTFVTGYVRFCEVDTAGHPPLLDTDHCWTPTTAGHPPLLDTHLCRTPTSAGHRPLLDTHLCRTPTTSGHPPLLDTHHCWTPITSGHPSLLDTHHFWTPITSGHPPLQNKVN